jgi:hypothetical protein
MKFQVPAHVTRVFPIRASELYMFFLNRLNLNFQLHGKFNTDEDKELYWKTCFDELAIRYEVADYRELGIFFFFFFFYLAFALFSRHLC